MTSAQLLLNSVKARSWSRKETKRLLALLRTNDLLGSAQNITHEQLVGISDNFLTRTRQAVRKKISVLRVEYMRTESRRRRYKERKAAFK